MTLPESLRSDREAGTAWARNVKTAAAPGPRSASSLSAARHGRASLEREGDRPADCDLVLEPRDHERPARHADESEDHRRVEVPSRSTVDSSARVDDAFGRLATLPPLPAAPRAQEPLGERGVAAPRTDGDDEWLAHGVPVRTAAFAQAP